MTVVDGTASAAPKPRAARKPRTKKVAIATMRQTPLAPDANIEGPLAQSPELRVTDNIPVSDNPERIMLVDMETGEPLGPDPRLDAAISGRKHYSHSYVENIATCVAKAHFRSLDIPKRPAFALERGSCTHVAIEAIEKREGDALTVLESEWKVRVLDNLEQMTLKDQKDARTEWDRTRRMVREWLVENDAILDRIRPEDVEVNFTLPVTMNIGGNKIVRPFNGKIDLVLWSADRTTYQIIDWKSGSKAPSDDALDRNLQFSLYQWAATQLFGKPPEKMYYYLLAGKYIGPEAKAPPSKGDAPRPNLEDFQFAFEVPLRTDEQIQTMFDTYYAGNILKFELGIISKEGLADFSNPCGRCEYREHCDTVTSFPAPLGVRYD